MIANLSYYVLSRTYTDNGKDTHYARFCDVDGNSLYRILLSPSEYDQASIHGSLPRLDQMLDPQCVGGAHPAVAVIDNRSFSLGRTVYFYNKHDDIIAYQSYNGPADLAGLVKYQLSEENNKSACRVDYDWMLANNTPVVDTCSSKISWCSLV